jgi:hypothetical protein
MQHCGSQGLPQFPLSVSPFYPPLDGAFVIEPVAPSYARQRLARFADPS